MLAAFILIPAGLGAASIITLSLLGLAIAAFEIWMFIDLILNQRWSTGAKVLWGLGMLLIHPFVAIIYFFVGRGDRLPPAVA